MRAFLNSIRSINKRISIKKQIIYTIGVLFLGIVLGVIAKYLDCTASNHLPFILEYLDITNFLGRFAIWIFLAVCISIYSASPIRAAINVFIFFAGMLTSYYLYSKLIAGFFPQSYAMIWVGITILSPFLAFLCWYSKGNGTLSLVISAGIFAVLFDMTFSYGWLYFDLRSPLELLVLISEIFVMRREMIQETGRMILIGIVFALILYKIFPFYFA